MGQLRLRTWWLSAIGRAGKFRKALAKASQKHEDVIVLSSDSESD